MKQKKKLKWNNFFGSNVTIQTTVKKREKINNKKKRLGDKKLKYDDTEKANLHRKNQILSFLKSSNT